MHGVGNPDRLLSDEEVTRIVREVLDDHDDDLQGKRVLIIVPDGTRTAPIPKMFRLIHQALSSRVAELHPERDRHDRNAERASSPARHSQSETHDGVGREQEREPRRQHGEAPERQDGGRQHDQECQEQPERRPEESYHGKNPPQWPALADPHRHVTTPSTEGRR